MGSCESTTCKSSTLKETDTSVCAVVVISELSGFWSCINVELSVASGFTCLGANVFTGAREENFGGGQDTDLALFGDTGFF
mmetsp:Transcript_20780/g.39593  ORF Transcript_20780/g.39593 Transcript_20780/m.39593 type:complete len:81 (+) Transcript_20780:711-953(+)